MPFAPTHQNFADLRRAARSYAANESDADDLAQEVVERASRLWASYDPRRGSVGAWLFLLMRSTAHARGMASSRRARGRAAYAIHRAREDERAREAADLDARHDRTVALDLALSRVPADQREVVVLVCVGGLSYAETAAEMECPIGTVMSRLHRARRRLHVLLRER